MVHFLIPRTLADLEVNRPGQLSAAEVPSVTDTSPDDVEAAYQDGLAALAEGQFEVLEQDTFNNLYIAIRGLELLAPSHAVELAKAMCQHLVVLVTSGLSELRAEERDKGDPVVAEHRSSIHVYVYFLHCIFEHCHAQAQLNERADAAAKGASKKRGARSKDPAPDDDDDGVTAWPPVRERIVRAFSLTLQADLDAVLYRSPVDKFRLLDVCVLTAARCLEDSAAAKQGKTLQACLEVFAMASTRHANSGCLDVTADALFRLVKEHEHGSDVAVQAAVHASKAHSSQTLAKALLAKFCEGAPEAYDEDVRRDTKPVKRAADLLSKMVVALPEVVHVAISQLDPYFGCQSATQIRSALVTCFGRLVQYYKARQARETGNDVLIKNMENAADTLLERINDVAALVRKAALSVIKELVKDKFWPLERMVLAAQRAVARLDDGSLAAGAALDLLCEMIGEWAPEQLTDAYWLAQIKFLEEKLKVTPKDTADDDEQDPRWEEGAQGDDTGARPQEPKDEVAGQAAGSQPPIIEPTQLQDGQEESGLTHSQLRFAIATCKVYLEFSRTLAGALPEVETLLTSDSADVAGSAIQLLTLCRTRQLQGVQDAWRRVWHLVFTPSEKVRETVIEAFTTFLAGDDKSLAGKSQQDRNRAMVVKLVSMVENIALCDQEALDELVRLAMQVGPKDPVLQPDMLRALMREFRKRIEQVVLLQRGSDHANQATEVARRLSVLCNMVVRHAPEHAVAEMGHLVACLKNSHVILKDAILVRNVATMLGDLAPALHAAPTSTGRATAHANTAASPTAQLPNALSSLLSVLVSSHLPETGGAWEPAAQAAIAAVYRLHTEPHTVMEAMLQRMAAETARAAAAEDGNCNAPQLSRVLFTVGCVATQQLALVDSLVKRVRRERNAHERAVAEAGRGGAAGADDMNAQLGTGQARDAQLDALQEALEAELSREFGLLGAWGKLVSGIAHQPDLLAAHPELAAAAMGTLAKLMALDGAYCDANAPVFFTRLSGAGNVKLQSSVRCSMLVALGDLGRRHPNIMEPWTERMFVCLKDEDEQVSQTCLRILAHLILSDMTKPKGHMVHVARCLVARSEGVRELAVRLFNSLASKQAKGGANKVYQYLPEIISESTRGEPMADQDYRDMMQRLLGYIKADKLADSLKVRVCKRFEEVVCEFPSGTAAPLASGVEDPGVSGNGATGVSGGVGGQYDGYEAVVREWRGLATCLELLPYSEKGLRSVMEAFRQYKHALGDEHVYRVFKDMAEHGRRGNRTAELKADVAEYEARLDEAHTSLREEQLQQAAAAAAARAAAAAAAAPAGADTAATAAGDQDAGVEQEQQAAVDEDMADDGGEEQEEDGAEAAQGERADGAQVPGADEELEDGSEDGEDEFQSMSGDGEEEEEGLEGSVDEGSDDDEDDAGGDDDQGQEDMDMDWEENGQAAAAAATPLGRRAGRLGADPNGAAATPGAARPAGTPMAITPIPQGGGGCGDDMAWSPAPAAAAALQENIAPVPFGGFKIKPDPEATHAAAMGPVAGVVAGRNVLGVRIKPDPEGRGW